jgi:ERCC4-type nuclease
MTHAVRILLDCHEPKELIGEFTAASKKKGKIPGEVQQLDLGDFIIEVDGVATTMVERKTWDDLWNSIDEGRFEHQRARYKNAMIACPGLNVFYVIEGNSQKIYNNTKSKQMAMSTAIENLTTIHHIGCRYTSNIKKTVELLLRAARKLAECGAPEYINPASLKEAKGTKAGITPEDWWPTALSRIPGVTFETASVIAERFPSQESLSGNASKLRDLERPGSKKRKVGDKLAAKIIEFTTPHGAKKRRTAEIIEID